MECIYLPPRKPGPKPRKDRKRDVKLEEEDGGEVPTKRRRVRTGRARTEDSRSAEELSESSPGRGSSRSWTPTKTPTPGFAELTTPAPFSNHPPNNYAPINTNYTAPTPVFNFSGIYHPAIFNPAPVPKPSLDTSSFYAQIAKLTEDYASARTFGTSRPYGTERIVELDEEMPDVDFSDYFPMLNGYEAMTNGFEPTNGLLPTNGIVLGGANGARLSVGFDPSFGTILVPAPAPDLSTPTSSTHPYLAPEPTNQLVLTLPPTLSLSPSSLHIPEPTILSLLSRVWAHF
jgi:hypothetical protein